MRLAIVSPLLKKFPLMIEAEPPPITCVTAIASPSARLSPRIIVAAMPGRVDERTTPRTISQRVVPSASAPSLSSFETLPKSSRLIDAMIGTTMIVRTTPAVKTPRPVGEAAPKIGIQPSTSCSAGSIVECMTGARIRIPQSPSTTLGIAAISSISGPITAVTRRGASRLRKRPIAIPIGPPSTSAIAEVIAVP